jgi:hypothetical protein
MADFNKYISATQHLRVSRHKMTPAWQAVHDFLKARGFHVAAEHMGDIIKLSTPALFWKTWQANGVGHDPRVP